MRWCDSESGSGLLLLCVSTAVGLTNTERGILTPHGVQEHVQEGRK